MLDCSILFRTPCIYTVRIFYLLYVAQTCYKGLIQQWPIWPIQVLCTCSTTLVLFPAEAAALGQPAIEDRRTSVNSKAAYTGEFLEEASSSTCSHKKIPAQSNIDLALCLHRFLVGLGWGLVTWPCLRWAGRGRWSSPSRAPPSGRRWTRSWSCHTTFIIVS